METMVTDEEIVETEEDADVEQEEERVTMAEVLVEVCPASQRQLLAKCLDIDEDQEEWSSIGLDFHFYNIHFCQEKKLSLEKTEAFVTIMKKVFDDTFVNDKSLDQTFEHFHTVMLQYSVHDPAQNTIALFDLADLRLLAEFISTTFFRHFKAYTSTYQRCKEERDRILAQECPVLTINDEQTKETPLNPLDFPLEEVRPLSMTQAPIPVS